MTNELIYSVAETSLLLKKSESWVYRAARAGIIAVARVGNSLRIPHAEIVRLLRPANSSAVQAWTRRELHRLEAKKDAALLREMRSRFSIKNMKEAPKPPEPGL
jgi:hypothetical protein